MNMKFFILILSLALVGGYNTKAEEVDDFGLDETVEVVENAETPMVEESVSKVAEEVETPEIVDRKVENSESELVETPVVETKEETEVEKVNDVVQPEELSAYIENLNLDSNQLIAAKKISEKGRLLRMQMLQNVEKIQENINDMEKKNLDEFEKILTSEQLETFRQMREAYIKEHQK